CVFRSKREALRCACGREVGLADARKRDVLKAESAILLIPILCKRHGAEAAVVQRDHTIAVLVKKTKLHSHRPRGHASQADEACNHLPSTGAAANPAEACREEGRILRQFISPRQEREKAVEDCIERGGMKQVGRSRQFRLWKLR